MIYISIVYILPFTYISYSFLKHYNTQKRLEQLGEVITPDISIIEGFLGQKYLKIRYTVDETVFYETTQKCSSNENCLTKSKSLKLIVNPENPSDYKYLKDFENFSVVWSSFFWGLIFFLFFSTLKRIYPKKLRA